MDVDMTTSQKAVIGSIIFSLLLAAFYQNMPDFFRELYNVKSGYGIFKLITIGTIPAGWIIINRMIERIPVQLPAMIVSMQSWLIIKVVCIGFKIAFSTILGPLAFVYFVFEICSKYISTRSSES